MWSPGSVEEARSVSLPDGVRDDLHEALVLLGSVSHMLVVFINCCLSMLFFQLVVWLVQRE